MPIFGPILGIETSCDETAAAVVTRTVDGPKILSNIVLSQIEEHSEFGGVVPEIAARVHLASIDKIVETALMEADCSLADIAGIGVTAGPGLIGGLMVGVLTAKAMSAASGTPFIGVNHLEGHALTARLTDDIGFPYLLLLVSGGHSQILKVSDIGSYKRIASTIDDAVGETFDKTAKLLGLGFPGGPNVEKAAMSGDPERFKFPRPLAGQDTLNMSFSGLKTAVRQTAEKMAPLTEQDIADICASMQKTLVEVLATRCAGALEQYGDDVDHLVVAGGVAANREIRGRLEEVAARFGKRLIAPPLNLCTDNAAMIAWAALERMQRGEASELNLSPKSRWPLDQESETMLGSGRKGAKV